MSFKDMIPIPILLPTHPIPTSTKRPNAHASQTPLYQNHPDIPKTMRKKNTVQNRHPRTLTLKA